MIPIRFGPSERQLFAMLHPPTASPRNKAVLLCNPFGQEAIRCHRMYRVMADQLARNGFYVMRFDYYGTGDSDGDDEEVQLETWCQDVLHADRELRERSACAHVCWFGIRLGASIAMYASIDRDPPLDRLVAWDPVLDGPSYQEEMIKAHADAFEDSFGARWIVEPRLREIAFREALDESLGFFLPSLLKQQIRHLSPSKLAAVQAKHIGIFANPASAPVSVFHQQLEKSGKSCTLTATETSLNWATNEAMDSAIVPPEAMQAVVSLIRGE